VLLDQDLAVCAKREGREGEGGREGGMMSSGGGEAAPVLLD